MHQIIAISLVMSLLLAELTPLTSAGMIVPGYIAFHAGNPAVMLIVVVATLFTWATEKLLSKIIILFGRRLLAMDVLLSFFYVQLFVMLSTLFGFSHPVCVDVLAYFVPALIVIFIGANGLKNTLISLLVLTAISWLILHGLLILPCWVSGE